MKAYMKRRCCGLVVLFSLLFLAASGTTAAEPYQLVIVPFKMNADRDLTFLKEGALDILASRLSWENKVTVVSREKTAEALKKGSEPVNEAGAQDLGRRLKADYVLLGSLTVFGNSVSLDGKIIDVHQKQSTLTLFKEGKDIDQVIPLLSLFATEIKERLFGLSVESSPKIAKAVPESPSPSIYAHPETLLADEPGGEEETVPEPSRPSTPAPQEAPPAPEPNDRKDAATVKPAPPVAGGFAEPPQTALSATTSTAFWKSPHFKFAIQGIALGDVDGDKKTEVVFISDRRVSVNRFQNQGLVKLWEKSGKRGRRYIGVDVADVNNNGRAEIFVTSVKNPEDRLSSFVLEWDGRAFQPISEEAPWYYRVVDLPHLGQVLLGQKRAMDAPFVREVHELAWANGKYEPQEPLGLPKGVNIYGFAQGDVKNNGLQMTIAFDREDRLRLFSLSGDEKWKSGERFGGNMNYVESWMKNSDISDRLYLPQRICVLDLNGDGKQEVVVPSNESQIGRLFAKFRTFSTGHMASLSWSGLTLAPELQTPKLEGYISDFGIGDFDHDGTDEVVVAHVDKGGLPIVGGSKSSIISYEINPKPSPAR